MAIASPVFERARALDVRRALTIAMPLGVLAVASVLRFTNLSTPDTLVFDETYYVKDSYSLWHLGYEGTWPDSNDAFTAGTVELSPAQSFVVHPPLGKWILGVGTAIGGIDDPFSWRWPAALVGVIVVALVMAITHGLTKSTAFASLAGFLLAIDGQAIVMSRTVLLDQTLAMFVLLGAAAMLIDRRGSPARILHWRHHHRGTQWMPGLWNRPWLIAAGVALGCATSVKWSGLYFLAAFGLWTVVMEVLDRRRANIKNWHVDTVVVQGLANFVLLVPTALVTYLVTWTGWFVSGGYGSGWAQSDPRNRLEFFSWIPLQLQNFVHFHQQIAQFHVGVTNEHPFQSPASEWMLMLRPTAFYLLEGDGAQSFITALPNPLVWYGGVIALIIMIFLTGFRLDRTCGFLVIAVMAGFLPWLAFPERTIFSFYTIVFEPFMVIGLAYLLWWWVRRGRPSPLRRRAGTIVTIAVVVIASALSVFFAPIWFGMWSTGEELAWRYWLPRWR